MAPDAITVISPRRQARSALAWGLVFFVGAQLAFLLVVQLARPELRDPEYGTKLAHLRARLAEEPGRPLLLVLGSSRVAMGFRPDAVADCRLPDGRAPVVFNFSLQGSGPILELMCLRRLLAAGVRPDALVVEVMPPFLHQEGRYREECWLNVGRLTWGDLAVLRRYVVVPDYLRRAWFEVVLNPWFSYRFCLMNRLAPDWLSFDARQDATWRSLDPSGWTACPRAALDAAALRRYRDVTRDNYQPSLDAFWITPGPDGALRELLALCGRRGIPVLLLLMPEGSEFRDWYSPAARAELQDYLTRLKTAFGTGLIDARAAMPDEAFIDGHHLLPAAAAAFTRRFAREAFPWLAAPQNRPRS